MKKLAWILVSLLLVGCSANTPVPTSPASDTATQTSVPKKTPTSSTAISEENINNLLQDQCPEIGTNLVSLQDVAKVGTVVLYDSSSLSPYLLNLETDSRYPLHLKKLDYLAAPSMHISPNGNYLAYIENVKGDLGYSQLIWVVDSKGSVLASQSINPELLFSEWRWLDDESIELDFQSLTPKDGTVAIYYPFKDEWLYLSNTLPNFYPYFDLDSTFWLVEYSANLNQVVYLGGIEEFIFGPILWDVDSGEAIWQMADSNTSVRIPRWSVSGDKVAIPNEGNLYIIDLDGQITTIPDLGRDSEIMNVVWSPDGNYIILLVRYNLPEIEGYVMLYDIQNNKVTNYCLQSDNLFAGSPLWSSDSQFFFFQLITMHRGGPRETPVLVDVKQNSVHLLPDDEMPLAWMNTKSE